MFCCFKLGAVPIVERLESRQLFAGAPLVITHGGTYTGTYTSTNPQVPAVTVDTDEPVTIQKATITGPGDLIFAAAPHANITIRNSKAYGVNPDIAGETKGRFIDADGFDNVIVENNYLEGTAGIFLLNYAGDRTASETVRIVGNRAKNVDGRKSDGKGGYFDFNTRVSQLDGHEEDGFKEVQFVQLNKVAGVPNVEIAWNEVVNEPGKSRVEDNINIYKSSGTQASPILIHDNYIQGAYTIKPWQKSHVESDWTWDWSYSGGGILLGDALGDDGPAGDPAYIRAYDNQVVSTTNYGIAISTGHDIEFAKNRIVSSGVLPDGRLIAAQNVGGYVWDSTEVGAGRFYNNNSRENTLGWNLGDKRNDWWIPNSASNLDNKHWPGTVTRETETAEYQLWLTKMYAKFPDRKPAAAKVSIAGSIFNDANGDGVRGSKDRGLVGFRVYLDLNNNKKFDKTEPSSRSTSTGRYSFNNLAAGAYNVRVTPVENWRETQGLFARVAVKKTGSSTRYFGFTRMALVTGAVFNDANNNRLRDRAEPLVAGWKVFIDSNTNGVLDAGESVAVSDERGAYALVVSPGKTSVRIASSSRYRITTAASQAVAVPVAAVAPVSFGVKRIS
ncbi:MAG TPA: SdrD B-like domain-containing protein [Tepidisphaeraceae bacterium]|jgi:hypothetical protein